MTVQPLAEPSKSHETRDTISDVRIYLGSDHAGFELKKQLTSHLRSRGYDIVDCEPTEYDPNDDYPPFCIDTAQRVVADPGSLGVVLGGSGNGEQISANTLGRTTYLQDHDARLVRRQRLNVTPVTTAPMRLPRVRPPR